MMAIGRTLKYAFGTSRFSYKYPEEVQVVAPAYLYVLLEVTSRGVSGFSAPSAPLSFSRCQSWASLVFVLCSEPPPPKKPPAISTTSTTSNQRRVAFNNATKLRIGTRKANSQQDGRYSGRVLGTARTPGQKCSLLRR